MFQPRYLKQAKMLQKGLTRFLHYKRDLIPAAKLSEIEELRTDLGQAIRVRNKERLDALTVIINQTCERAVPMGGTSDWAENIEVFFVSIVIALGIRTYIAQPFQIPTSSMQPTLNGINAEITAEDPRPGLLGKVKGFFTGTSYINVVADQDGEVDLGSSDMVTEHKFLIFRPYSKLHFTDGHTITINSPKSQLENQLRLYENLQAETAIRSDINPDMRSEVYVPKNGRARVSKGQILARGIVTNGDHVIVNKFAYHFRQPTRGEVFVFTTKSIQGIENTLDRRWGSQYYIKRLVGVPGDEVAVESPELFINGQKPTEPGIRRVIDQREPRTREYAYHGYSDETDDSRMIYVPQKLQVAPRRQYYAMGDNSYRSSDSRFWGPVPEQNLIGPGWFCYWPLTSHWGRIK